MVQKGANPEKVNIGLATYGRTFTLVIPSANEIGAPSRDSGEAGPYTRERGLLAYYEVCISLWSLDKREKIVLSLFIDVDKGQLGFFTFFVDIR